MSDEPVLSQAHFFPFFNSLFLFANEKIDPAIDLKKSGFIPVFVRMSDQLITRAGEYERLSVAYSENSRSENHQQVLTSLQKKARDSWELVSEKTSKPRRRERFVILKNFGS